MEQLGRITKWLPHYRPRTPDMVVNIEWPGFQVAALLELAPAVIGLCCEAAPLELAGLSQALLPASSTTNDCPLHTWSCTCFDCSLLHAGY